MKEHPAIPPTVAVFIDELSSRPAIVRLVIFGSRAVGDNKATADIDLAVFAPSLSRREFARIRVDAYEADSAYWISPVHYDGMTPDLQARIDQQGVTLYERH